MKNNLILIFGILNDRSSIEVKCWLNKFKYYPLLLSNLDDIICNNRIFISNNIKSVWYRKYEINQDCFNIIDEDFISSEHFRYLNYLYNSIKTVKSLGNGFKEMDIDKNKSLFYANEVGLCTPNTIITSSKAELIKFYSAFKMIITKPIFNAVSIDLNDSYIGKMYTALIEEELINELPDFFSQVCFRSVKLAADYLKL